jgi:simple sugar transport system permease protein
MDWNTLLLLLDSTVRLATPLLLACLAGLFSERAGIFDIGLEGKMLIAAFLAAAVASLTGSALMGLLVAIVGACVFSAIHGLAAITFRGNQLISGVALNFLASGLTIVVGQYLFGEGGRTPAPGEGQRFTSLSLPGFGELRDIPFLGPLLFEVVSGQTIITYLAFLAVPLSWWVLYRTRFGLRLRAVGENPAAVDTAGISVRRLRFAAVGIAGLLCALAGAQLSIAGNASGFGREMTAGRGYIALAALIFAKWRPVAAMWACLLFGFLQALALQPAIFEQLAGIRIQTQFLDALPYILTVVILAGFVGRAIPPRAGGEPYVKER